MANPIKEKGLLADKYGRPMVTDAQTFVADTAAATSVAVATTGATSTTPFGYTTAAQADAIVTAINAIRTDLAATRTTVLAILDVLEAHGLMKDA